MEKQSEEKQVLMRVAASQGDGWENVGSGSDMEKSASLRRCDFFQHLIIKIP